MAEHKLFVSLVKMKQNPLRVAYPMSLHSLVRYLAERLATVSRSPAGTRPLRKYNKRKLVQHVSLGIRAGDAPSPRIAQLSHCNDHTISIGYVIRLPTAGADHQIVIVAIS